MCIIIYNGPSLQGAVSWKMRVPGAGPPAHPEHIVSMRAPARPGKRSRTRDREPPHTGHQLFSAKKKKKGTNTHSKPRAFGQEWAPYVCQQHPLVASLSTTPSIPRMKPFPRLSRQTLTKSGYRSPRPNAAMRCGALPATHLIFTLIQ